MESECSNSMEVDGSTEAEDGSTKGFRLNIVTMESECSNPMEVDGSTEAEDGSTEAEDGSTEEFDNTSGAEATDSTVSIITLK